MNSFGTGSGSPQPKRPRVESQFVPAEPDKYTSTNLLHAGSQVRDCPLGLLVPLRPTVSKSDASIPIVTIAFNHQSFPHAPGNEIAAPAIGSALDRAVKRDLWLSVVNASTGPAMRSHFSSQAIKYETCPIATVRKHQTSRLSRRCPYSIARLQNLAKSAPRIGPAIGTQLSRCCRY